MQVQEAVQSQVINPFIAGKYDFSRLRMPVSPEQVYFEGIPDEQEILELYEYLDPEDQAKFDALLAAGSEVTPLLPHQIIPWWRNDWNVFALEGGRGIGKTYTGSNGVIEHIHALGRRARVGLAAPTNTDARDVMMEGEALALDTPIPTPSGWTTMGQLRKGDIVFDEQGKPCRITLVSDVKYGRPCYRVVFSDGSEIVTDENHKWLTYTRAERRPGNKKQPQVRTTREIGETLITKSGLNHGVRVSGALDLPSIPLPIDPYVLGVWLGDGKSKSGSITTADQGILNEFAEAGYQLTQHKQVDGLAGNFGILGLQRELAKLGLLLNKHIPGIYLRASYQQRLALLQGLMDTDGYISQRGQCAFDNTNLAIINAVIELLGSLGIKASRRQEKIDWRKLSYKTIYRVTFTTDFQVFRLPRKLVRLRKPRSPEVYYRNIKHVIPIPSVPVKCIAIDSPSHLYLATKAFIPTHNTGLMTLFSHEFKSYNRSLGQIEARHKSGAYVRAMGTEKPQRWNGPQWSILWIDEYALCNPAAIQDAMLGLRLGPKSGPYRARAIVTFTPKGMKWTRELMSRPDTFVPFYIDADGQARRPTTFDNPYLPEDRVKVWRRDLLGTTIGRRELLGIENFGIAGAKWRPEIIRHETDSEKWPRFVRRVVAIDPAGTAARSKADENGASDEDRKENRKRSCTSICVKAMGTDNRIYTLSWVADRWTPNEWATKAVELFRVFRCDRIVAERNFGGLMVESTLRNVWADAPITLVNASQGKHIRAEPVVALYEQGREIHCVVYDKAEHQLCSFIDADHNDGADYVDSGVWASYDLMGWGQDVPFHVMGKLEELNMFVMS